MVKAIINIPEQENRILNIVTGKYGFKNKEQAFIFLLQLYGGNLEPQLRPEYIEKLKKIDKRKDFIGFDSIKELRESIENA